MSAHSNLTAGWGTCGGLGFNTTNCAEGYVCVVIDQWYHQCYAAPPLDGKTCITCGSPNTDVAGIGVLLVFTSQTVLALVLTMWACMIKDEDVQRYVVRVLLTITDVQCLNGIGLAISAIINHRSEDIYHLRLIYDNITLAGISIWPTSMLLRSFESFESRQDVRQLSSSLFAVFYFIFSILLIVRLRSWNNYIPGQCYESGFLHSLSAIPYIAISGPLLVIFMVGSAWALRQWWTASVLFFAVFEMLFPLISIGSLRRAPQNFLVQGQGGDNQFGYGQIMVMVALLAIPFESYRCYRDYRIGKEEPILPNVVRLKSLKRPLALPTSTANASNVK